MEGGNSRPAPQEGAEQDWRLQLSEEYRNGIVNRISDTLKKCLQPISGPDGLGELHKIAVRFEEKIYSAATSQQQLLQERENDEADITLVSLETEYLRRISVKMLTMETKSQSGVADSSGIGGQNPSDSGSNSMQSQMRILGQQPLPRTVVNPSQTHLQMLPQNSIPSAAVQNSGSLSATMSSMTGLTQTSITNVAGQNANSSLNMGGATQGSCSNFLIGRGVQPNVFANAQKQQQLQGSQQQQYSVYQQLQRIQQQQYSFYQQQQLGNQLLNLKIQQQLQPLQGNMQSLMLHSHLQQQQQQQQSSLLQCNQLLGSQQSLIMQMASGHSSTQALQQPSPSMMHTVPQSGLQQNQQAQYVLHQHQQSLLRQQQQSQQSSAHHQALIFQNQQAQSVLHQHQQSLLRQQQQSQQSSAHHQLKSMKDIYYKDINDLLSKLTARYQQYNTLPQGEQIEEMDEVKMVKTMLENLVQFSSLTKSDDQPDLKRKLALCEKQIANVIPKSGENMTIPLLQQVQQHSVQMPQLQQHDDLGKLVQPLSIRSSANIYDPTSKSMVSTQQNWMAPLLQNSWNEINQPSTKATQSSFKMLQPQQLDQPKKQQPLTENQQPNSVNGIKLGSISNFSLGVNVLPPNSNSLQFSMMSQPQQLLKQQQDQNTKQQLLMHNHQLMQNPQVTKQVPAAKFVRLALFWWIIFIMISLCSFVGFLNLFYQMFDWLWMDKTMDEMLGFM